MTPISHARDARLLILSNRPEEVIRQDGLEIQVVDVIEWLLNTERYANT